ncbi:hypothetical protein FRB95_014179 [Tulasnella sp. JGI-2019a]|nr:hypothetical protein FRB93_001848 [Tulasnella sp. JGI-2019a]KAG9033857.1 hypothetical protein FRB95_014179 [Tulasnella sp. JGI-2019a]
MSDLDLSWLVPNSSMSPTWITALARLLSVIITMNLLAKIIRVTILVPKLTIMGDLPHVGNKRKDGKIKGRAVVCGGSIAGLLAATVCSDHFESVLVVEAEGSPTELGMDKPKELELRTMADGLMTPIPLRKRLIQYLGLHGFLPPFILGLQRLFPKNLDSELAYFGFSLVPFTFVLSSENKSNPEVFAPGDPNTPLGLPIMRNEMESLLRRLVVKSRTNITFITGTIDGFQRQRGNSPHLSGVTVRDQGEEAASFVIDATGPTQSSYHRWLKNAGFGPLPSSLQSEYDPNLTYAQSVYTFPKKLLPKVEDILPYGLIPGAVWGNSPDASTGGSRMLYMYFHEGHQLVIVAGGWGVTEEQRPHTADEVRSYAKTLHNAELTPEWIWTLFDFLEDSGEECTPWYADYRPGRMSFIKYQDAENGTLPNNWIAMGDSLIKLNPIYGQGCTKAMMDAVTLDSLLRHVPSQQDLPPDFSKKFFHKAVARTKGIWDGNKANDYGFSTTEPAKGETLATGSFARSFGRYLTYAGRTSYTVHSTFLYGITCLAPTTDFFVPSVLIRVAWQWWIN